jgi:hypothetical protein
MDFDWLSFDLNMGFVHDFLNLIDESNSIVTQTGKGIRLEQSLQGWKEGLKVFKVPRRPIQFRILVKSHQGCIGSKVLAHCSPLGESKRN